MECFLQYLDDLDDLFGALGLIWEKLRRSLVKLVTLAMIIAAAAGGILLARAHPPIALATSTMLFVILLYLAVTVPSARWTAAS